MAELQQFPLQTTSGRSGYVLRASRFLDRNQSNHVRLDDGTEFDVPSNALNIRPDGSFLLEDGQANAAPASPPTVPVHPPAASDEQLFGEDVSVERVPVNRILDGPIETRHEGDTTIIPVIEEVLTVQKRLFLREEVRITRRRTPIKEPRRILLNGIAGQPNSDT